MTTFSLYEKFKLACRAFIKAWKDPAYTQLYLEGLLLKELPTTGDVSHLRLLYFLQQGSRLIDFLKEDITQFTDAQVGAAVRKIHQDSGKVLEELITIRPLRTENEGATITVSKGYDPSEIKLVGKVTGEPPFTGKLIHRGWKAHKRSLPKMVGEQLVEVVCPAEIEIR